MVFVGILSQIKLLFEPLVIQLVWYKLKKLFTSVSVKVMDIYFTASQLGKYPPLFTSTSVNNCHKFFSDVKAAGPITWLDSLMHKKFII